MAISSMSCREIPQSDVLEVPWLAKIPPFHTTFSVALWELNCIERKVPAHVEELTFSVGVVFLGSPFSLASLHAFGCSSEQQSAGKRPVAEPGTAW